jgi:hypothetical protein
MKHFGKAVWFVLFWALGVPALVLAQADSCPNIVQKALTAVDQSCQSTGRNQACYGNVLLTANPQPNVTDFNFQKAGDITDLAKIKDISLSELDAQTDVWGVALMRLQANLPDTLPGQNVTMLLFGNVQITNAATSDQPAPVLLNATPTRNANVRAAPSTSGAVVGSVASGKAITADGRNDAGDWLRIQLSDTKVGWVSASLVKVDGDATTLPVKDASDTTPVAAAPHYDPMQAFYFKSGIGDAPCNEAPDSGILVQTPEGADKITLSVNGADIELGSTGYLQAQPSADMELSIVEGEGRVTAKGVTRVVPAGTRVGVPLDANLQASGAPGNLETYDDAKFKALPVSLLQRKIQIAPALTADQIAVLSTSIVGGTWQTSLGQVATSGSCPGGMGTIIANSMASNMNKTFTLAGGEFHFNEFSDALGRAFGGGLPPGTTINNPEPGHYTFEIQESDASASYDLRVVSPTGVEMTIVITSQGCTITIPWHMEAVGS